MELLVQVQGQEGEDIVLGRVDDVVLEREPGGGAVKVSPRPEASRRPRPARPCHALRPQPAVTEHLLRARPRASINPAPTGCRGSQSRAVTFKVDTSYFEGFALTYFNGHRGGAKETENSHQKDDLFIVKTGDREAGREAGGEGGAGALGYPPCTSSSTDTGRPSPQTGCYRPGRWPLLPR